MQRLLSLFFILLALPLQGFELAALLDQYEELSWLTDGKVRKTEQEIDLANGNSYSESLFRQKFPEFERTVTSLDCFELLLKGDTESYRLWIQKQPPERALSKASFEWLHTAAIELLNGSPSFSPEQMHHLLIVAIIIDDVGKAQFIHDAARPYGVNVEDHDDFLVALLEKCPHLLPSFSRLPQEAKAFLKGSFGLAHFGHIAHLEGGPEMFHRLKELDLLQNNPYLFKLAYFVHFCDVAGTLGHVCHEGSLAMDERVYQTLMAVSEACNELRTRDEKAAFNHYLAKRAEWLGLDASNPIDRLLTRIGAMLRLYTPQEGLILKQTYETLDDKTLIIAELNPDLATADFGRTPTYMPALLVNLAHHPLLGTTPEARLAAAIKLGLPFIATVLKQHKQDLSEGKASLAVPLNFNPVAGSVKKDPYQLQEKHFQINACGEVILQDN